MTAQGFMVARGTSMSGGHEGWRAGAGYFYVMHLPRALLAWEFLRRNAAYREDWKCEATRALSAPRWGLRFCRRSRARRP